MLDCRKIFSYHRRMEKNLDAEVRALLTHHRGEWRAISNKSGVSYSWISKFVNGHISNPGYNTLVLLRKQLARTKAK